MDHRGSHTSEVPAPEEGRARAPSSPSQFSAAISTAGIINKLDGTRDDTLRSTRMRLPSAARRTFCSGLALALSSLRPRVPLAFAASQVGLDGRIVLEDAKRPSVDILLSPPKVTARTYLDVGIGGSPAGRIEIDLFGELCPRAAENFRQLATGQNGFGYAGSSFYTVISNLTLQAGGIPDGPRSIYGPTFTHDNYAIKHNVAGLVSCVNSGVGGGSQESDSRFLVQLVDDAGFLDGRYEAFGRVTAGMEVVRRIEQVRVAGAKNAPVDRVTIDAAGVLP